MTADLIRRLENLVRFGVIHSIDYAEARCIVDFQGIMTKPLPWLTIRAGSDATWDSPSVGEQVVVLSPSGELANGLVLFGMYSNTHPAPSASPDLKIRKFSDGATISYNTATHHLDAILPAGGTATLTAKGGVTINGDTTINGNVTTNGNVQTNGNTSMTGNNAVGGSQTVAGTSQSTGSFTCAGDVVASGISLTSHKHSGVRSGSDTSGGPQ